MYFYFRIKIPLFLARILLWLYLQYKKFRCGCRFRYILLNNGRFALVEAADYDKLMRHKWSVRTAVEYALREEKGKTIYMHNEIMQPQPDLVIDHKDHNGLNNSRQNLRIATKSQNCCNQKKVRGNSRYKGVSCCKNLGKWRAYIGYENKIIFLGYFENEIDAAKAYDKAAKELHGEFAVLNFP